MAPDVLVLMSIGSVSFIASYLTLLAQLPPKGEEDEGPEVTYCAPPPLLLRWAQGRAPASARRKDAPSAPPRLVLELDGEGWHLSVEPLTDVPARAVSMPSGAHVTGQDLRWSGAVALEKPRVRRRVPVKPGKA